MRFYGEGRGFESVAPHAGSVDRNVPSGGKAGQVLAVAPHAGSVDRNSLGTKDSYGIEQVAPHAGSVDRNI